MCIYVLFFVLANKLDENSSMLCVQMIVIVVLAVSSHYWPVSDENGTIRTRWLDCQLTTGLRFGDIRAILSGRDIDVPRLFSHVKCMFADSRRRMVYFDCLSLH